MLSSSLGGSSFSPSAAEKAYQQKELEKERKKAYQHSTKKLFNDPNPPY
jgi:hypothetical protein